MPGIGRSRREWGTGKREKRRSASRVALEERSQVAQHHEETDSNGHQNDAESQAPAGGKPSSVFHAGDDRNHDVAEEPNAPQPSEEPCRPLDVAEEPARQCRNEVVDEEQQTSDRDMVFPWSP